jgi:hypothetical protein
MQAFCSLLAGRHTACVPTECNPARLSATKAMLDLLGVQKDLENAEYHVKVFTGANRRRWERDRDYNKAKKEPLFSEVATKVSEFSECMKKHQ